MACPRLKVAYHLCTGSLINVTLLRLILPPSKYNQHNVINFFDGAIDEKVKGGYATLHVCCLPTRQWWV